MLADVKAYLKAQSGVTDEVGAGADAAIWIGILKQGFKQKAITLQGFAGESFHTLAGRTDIGQTRVEITCWASDGGPESEADAVMEAVDTLMRPSSKLFKDTMGGRAINEITAMGTPDHGRDNPTPGDQSLRFWNSQDYLVTANSG